MTPDGPPAAAAGRSLPVRLLLRFVHRDDRGRRLHPAARWLLAQHGRDPVRFGMTVPCRQCGERALVRLVRLSPRRGRYWCGRCGAVVTLTARSDLRLVADRPPPAAPVPVAGSRPDGVDVRQVMPAAMLGWVESRTRRPISVDRLDKPTMYQLYKRWDTHLAGLAVEGSPPAAPGLPSFSAVVGALHDRCYRTELVVETLAGTVAATHRALYERVEHARRWLATRAGELCWIVSRVPQGALAVPDRGEVEAAVAALRSGGQPGPAAGRAARAALFGTDGGPTLRTLQAVYPAEEMLVALDEYLVSGRRPLRADVLSHLTAPGRTVP
jgi:hypothetical protein